MFAIQLYIWSTIICNFLSSLLKPELGFLYYTSAELHCPSNVVFLIYMQCDVCLQLKIKESYVFYPNYY